MAQHKKPAIHDAILAAAHRLFSARGYANTTLAEIAREAGISAGNVYIYFDSKLQILFSIYDPLLRARIGLLEKQLARSRSPKKRLRLLLIALWREIPAEDNGFLNNIMQAISGADPAQGYRSTLVQWLEDRISTIIMSNLSPKRALELQHVRIAKVLIMAFDGFAIHQHLHPDEAPVDDATIDAMVSMLMGES